MGLIEKKITTAILTLIRSRRREDSPAPGRASDGISSSYPVPAKLREASFSDFEAVAELKSRWNAAADSFENWERLWRQNPALAHAPRERPIGWVLEAGGKIVGYIGNISLLYRQGDRTLTAVAGHGLVVDPPYRAISMSLNAAFFRQKSVDLYVTTSAIESVGKITRSFKSDPVPQPDYEIVLFWVLKPVSFARAMIGELKISPIFSKAGCILASLAVGADKILRRRWPRQSSADLEIHEMSASKIGDDFEKLWMEKLTEDPRLFADRTPTTLRWHFEIPGDRGNARALCCRKSGQLVGYAIIRNDPQPDGSIKSVIADILARQDDPNVLGTLMVAAYDHAKRNGSYILEIMGFPASVRQVCLQWNPYLRKYPSSPFYYKAADPTLHKKLSDGQQWYASPFDGDATLIRPSYSSSKPDTLRTKSALAPNISRSAAPEAQTDVFQHRR